MPLAFPIRFTPGCVRYRGDVQRLFYFPQVKFKQLKNSDMKRKLNWYKLYQNNSGGSFVVDQKLCHMLLIQAETSDQADNIAEDMGVYFDGVYEGSDCPCCGDRWDRSSIVEFPLKWNKDIVFKNVEDYSQYLADYYGWTKPDIRIFYADGSVKEIFKNTG